MYTYTLSLFSVPLPHPPPYPSRSPQSTELSSYVIQQPSTSWLFYMLVSVSQCYSPNSSYLPLPPLCPHVPSLCLCLYSFLAIGSSVLKKKTFKKNLLYLPSWAQTCIFFHSNRILPKFLCFQSLEPTLKLPSLTFFMLWRNLIL